MSWLASHANTENCYLTTVGRRTGRSHEVEIWFGVVDDTLYLISGNGPGADKPFVVGDFIVVGELMGTKYPWDGDASIGLTFEAWCFDVPALAIESWTSHAT